MSKKTPLEAGFVARAVAGLRFAFTGDGGAWFGPAQPLPAAAPDEARGRRFDYPFAYNLQNNRPKASEGTSFAQLRALADGCDVLRLVIETRKDQLCSLPWTLRRRDVPSTAQREDAAAPDAQIDAAVAFLRRPDRQHNWGDWLRMVLEDLLVIDAPAIYPRPTKGGSLYALEPVDGASILCLLDASGRTPKPPDAAWQQIIKGLPATSYTSQELIYRPRNPRTHRVYGYSPVEHIITTVNIALRRQAHTLEYYRSGSVPDALVGVPAEWTPEQIRQWQEWWDALLEGDLAARRKTRFVPGDLARNFHETKQPPLKDQFDEWLARVVCFCFSIEPTPFVAQVNRAVAETSREQSLSEGLLPLKSWVKLLMDDILELHMGLPEVEFAWADEDIIDAETRMRVLCGYKNAGILTVNEIRAELGREPMQEPPPAPQDEDANTDADADANADPPPDPQPKATALKRHNGAAWHKRESAAKKALRPIKADRQEVVAARKELTAAIDGFFKSQAADVAAQIAGALGLTKRQRSLWNAEDDEDDEEQERQRQRNQEHARRAVSLIDFLAWSALAVLVLPSLERVAADGAQRAYTQAGAAASDEGHGAHTAEATSLRERARQWASERAAEMVGMKWVAGVLMPNPDARWQITQSTREMVRALVVHALQHGWSADKLAAELAASAAFGRKRAQMIARTELARADLGGQLIGWQASGRVKGKRWLTAQDEKVSGPCRACEDAGELALDAPFPSGEYAPPNHPNCRCVLLPVLEGEEEGEAGKYLKAFNPGQARDERGRWTDGGSAALSAAAKQVKPGCKLEKLYAGQVNQAQVMRETGFDVQG